MRRRWRCRILWMFVLLVSVLGTGFYIDSLETQSERRFASAGDVTNAMVIPGGQAIGIYMKTDGVFVLGTEEIQGDDGQVYEPGKHIVKAGDYITKMNGVEVSAKKELIREIEKLTDEKVILELRRDGEVLEVELDACEVSDGEYKLGIWVRDSVQGLGTVTYITEELQFGALGHGIHDSDTDELLEIEEGRVYETKILRIEKGKKGTPGGMEGMIVYNRYNILGSIARNTENGVFGELKALESLPEDVQAVPVGKKSEVKAGPASIRCCVEGEVKEYEIKITRINHFALESNKGMVIEITDPELLEVTGGIVQGMSGSPILQNGKIVGAVTHVLVNDPTRGYGIFIEEMMK